MTTAGHAMTEPVRIPYLTPVPDSLPPYDDERTALRRLRALSPAAAGRVPAVPTSRVPAVPLGRVPAARTGSTPAARSRGVRAVRVTTTTVEDTVPGWSREADVGVRSTSSADLPPAGRAAQLLARALIEVLSHQRPLAQLRTYCAPDVFAGLQARQQPTRTLASVRMVRVCEPADGVAEVTVVARAGQRAWALAFRMEGIDGRWRITAVETA